MKIQLIYIIAIIILLSSKSSCQANKYRIIENYEEPSLPLQVLCETPDNNIKCITLCTHATIDRLHLLPLQNFYWQGPMSIAITINNSEEDWNRLNNFLNDHFNTQNEDATSIASFASVHVIVSNEPISKHNYPINMVRNIAIKNAYTDWVFSVDVDFMPTASGHLKALQHKKFILNSYLSASKKAAFVIPAFEIDKPKQLKIHEMPFLQMKEAIQNMLPDNKHSLYEMYKNGEILGFHEKSFPKGHGQTDLMKWFEDIESYEIKYKDKYEPFLLFNRKNTPKYDESFEGRYYNKVYHVWELNQEKFRFFVLKDIYIIHLNHKKFSDPETRESNLKKFHEKTKGQRIGSKSNIKDIIIEDLDEEIEFETETIRKGNMLVNSKLELNKNKMVIPGWSCIYGQCNYKRCSNNDNRLCLILSPIEDAEAIIRGYPHRYMNVIAQTIDTSSIQNEILELQMKMLVLEKINVQDLPLEVWIEIQSNKNNKNTYRTYPIEIDHYDELIDMNLLSFKPFSIHDDNIISISVAIVYNTESHFSQNLIIDSVEVSLLLGEEKNVYEELNEEQYSIMRNVFNVHYNNSKSITLVGHSFIEDIQEVRDSLIKFGNEEMLSLSLYSLTPSVALKVLKEESYWLKNHLVHIITPNFKNLEYPDNILIKTAIDASSTEWVLLTDLNIKLPKCFDIQEFKNDINRLKNELNQNIFILPVYENEDNHCDLSKLRIHEGKFNLDFLRGSSSKDYTKIDYVNLIPYPIPIVFRLEEFPEQDDFINESKWFTSLTNLWILNQLANQNNIFLLDRYFLYHNDKVYSSLGYKNDIEKIYDFLRYLNDVYDDD